MTLNVVSAFQVGGMYPGFGVLVFSVAYLHIYHSLLGPPCICDYIPEYSSIRGRPNLSVDIWGGVNGKVTVTSTWHCSYASDSTNTFTSDSYVRKAFVPLYLTGSLLPKSC